MSKRLIVRLDGNVKPFTASRALRGMRFLGTVQRAYGIGALAITATGNYVQVNGDVVQSLDAQKVEAALRVARAWLEKPGHRGRYAPAARYTTTSLGARGYAGAARF